MKPRPPKPPVTICVLTYADYARLVRRCVESIRRHSDRSLYRLVVGANAPGAATRRYLERLAAQGAIDRLVVSETNLNKCPMMRRMFEGISTRYLWWFDDDSYVTGPRALPARLAVAAQSSASTVMWGEVYLCEHPRGFYDGDPVAFVRSAPWYRGLTPPFWEPGGKGELDFDGRGTGDGRWLFVLGGCWFVRTWALRRMDWPDRRLAILGDDVFMGEAVRQQGWTIRNTGPLHVAVNRAKRRWTAPRL
jgi:GT2 family glycosyltransferase